ncbi:DUF2993 domain-containing protein [Kitasatospora sp. NPDC057223]|uniref:LmeA family phospholipid-binding protein n=1 Tax=Kitasatospora sp. NPDC057223 TaxID=3346055 RepID=UPI003639CB25
MRGWLKVTVGLAVLSGLLVGADRIAVGVAEGEVADQLVQHGVLSQRPQVSIEGFPFLTQALSMKLDDVRLSADGLMVGDGRQQVALHAFTARLSGVAVSDSFNSATVASGTGEGLVTYADLSRILPEVSGARFALSYGGPGKVKASLGSVPVGEGTVHAKGNTVTADGFQLTGVAAMLNGVANQKLGPFALSLKNLPAGLDLADAQPQPDGVRLTFRGTGLKLTG